MRGSCVLVFAQHYGSYIAAHGQTKGVFLRGLMYMKGMGKNTFRSPLSENQFGENYVFAWFLRLQFL